MSPGEPILLEKTQGRFDFLRIDPVKRRLLLAHTANKSLDVVDLEHKYLFQVLKDANLVAVIDPSDNKVLESWPTAPAASPHGLSLVLDSGSLLVAGGNGKLVLIDRSTGKVRASADIAPRVDEMAYDPELHQAYCASGQGKISVVGVSGDKLTSLGEAASMPGLHSIAVDPKTHLVWIAYSKDDLAFAQPFVPSH